METVHASLPDLHRYARPCSDERCLFGRAAKDLKGNLVIRPKEYDPPAGWVPPHLRLKTRQDRGE